MSFSRLRKAPGRLLERVSNWRTRRSRSRQNSESSHGHPRDISSGSRGVRGGSHIELHDFEEDSSSIVADEPILSEKDHKELMNLLSRNISMDFILEMKEAFQLFDKVRNSTWILAEILGIVSLQCSDFCGVLFFEVLVTEYLVHRNKVKILVLCVRCTLK